MTAKHEDLFLDLVDDSEFVPHFPVLQNVRDHIVPIHVSRQVQYPLEDLIQDGPNLILLAVLKHALNHSAAVLVHAHFVHLALKGLDDELHFLRVNGLDYLLNDVVPVGVLNAPEDFKPDLIN